jgi:signal transduction histidine kinase
VITLETSELFRDLKPEDLRALKSFAQERKYRPGDDIFREGDAGDGIYWVKEGLVEISGIVGQNVRVSFSKVGPGEIFGEMAVLEDKPRSASATAREDTIVYFLERAQMLKLVERSPALSLSLLREISHRLREFNRQYLREVLQTERLAIVGRFARSIVHDLKNPLNIIGLTAEMAGSTHAPPEMRRDAQARIRKEVDRISDMIGEILDFTQGSQSAVILGAFDYGEYVERLLEEIRPEAALKSAALELGSRLPQAKVLLDPKRLRRVFHNLIHNATDAMPRGGKVIVRFIPKKTEIVTEIEDTGSGIAPEIAGQLFEAFVTHGKAHGTGLGLSISKRIIEDHRGWISARNEPGRGAIFSFGLPLANQN